MATAQGAPSCRHDPAGGPDVVLLDIRMPGVDGLPVLRQLRALPDAPVVAMLTTFDADEYIVTALRTGAADFLLKDTEPDQLARLVQTLDARGVVMSPKAAGREACLGAGAGHSGVASAAEGGDHVARAVAHRARQHLQRVQMYSVAASNSQSVR